MTKPAPAWPSATALFGTAQNPFAQNPFAQSPFFQNPFAGGKATANPLAANPLAGNPFAAGHHHAMTAWVELNRAMLEGVGKLQQETSRFVIRRLEDDLERQREILEAKSPEQAWQAYADFARKAVEDYTAEAGKLSEIAAEMQYACSGFGEMLASAALEEPPGA